MYSKKRLWWKSVLYSKLVLQLSHNFPLTWLSLQTLYSFIWNSVLNWTWRIATELNKWNSPFEHFILFNWCMVMSKAETYSIAKLTKRECCVISESLVTFEKSLVRKPKQRPQELNFMVVLRWKNWGVILSKRLIYITMTPMVWRFLYNSHSKDSKKKSKSRRWTFTRLALSMTLVKFFGWAMVWAFRIK